MNPVRSLVQSAIADGAFPGAAWAYGTTDRIERGVAGRQTYCPESRAIDGRTIWDLASVSKVVATTTLAMRMVERGALDLDRPVAETVPQFGQNGKARITPRNLLRHDAGLIAFRPYHERFVRPEDVLAAIDAETLRDPVGSKSVYSDLSMIVLARLLSVLDGRPFETMVRDDAFRQVGMRTAGYFGPAGPTMLDPVDVADVAPTESVAPWRRELRRATFGEAGARRRFGSDPEFIRAEVHDPTATVLGGIAGHAGLFARLEDLVVFVQELFSDTPRLFTAATRYEFTRRQEEKSSRALGWDTRSAEGSSSGSRFGDRSFGHTGYTGTSIWIDPDSRFFTVLLTNRVHPVDGNKKLLRFRPVFHDAVWNDFWAEGPGCP